MPGETALRFNLRSSLAALALFHGVAEAQTDATTEQDFFDDGPLILTVSRMTKPLLESPASVSVIDREMIQASGARDLADLFRLVPGFVVGYYNGHSPAVSYHGLGAEFARQTQVLIDGRSVFIPSFGGIPWSNLPLLLQDIERIEVIRGPNAVTYGANAFLATINIITRHPAEDLGLGYAFTSSDNASPDIEDSYLRLGSQHEDIDWRLSLGSNADEGFDGVNDSKRIGKANFRLDFLSSSNQFWTLQFGSSSSVAGRGFPPSEDTVTDLERDEEASNHYINLHWEGVWDRSTSSLRLTQTRQEVTDNYDPGPLEIELGGFSLAGVTTYIDFDRTSERTDLEFTQSNDIGERLRLVYGAGLRQDKVRSLFLFNDSSFHEVDTSRLFGAAELRISENWLLDLGVMLEDSNLTSQESSPRVSLIRKFGSEHALRLVASTARRNPVLYEYEGETEFSADIPAPISTTITLPRWSGNDEVEPEKIQSYEIGLRSRISRVTESDIKIFTYEISDHLIGGETEVDLGLPFGVVDVETAVNDESSRVSGVEFALGYRPDAKLAVHSGFSVVDFDTTCDDGSSCDDFEDSYPDHTAFLAAAFRIAPRHEVSGAYYYVDEISWLDSSNDIPISRRLDLRYLYRWRSKFNVELVGQNLLEDVVDYQDENVRDQLVFLRLSGAF